MRRAAPVLAALLLASPLAGQTVPEGLGNTWLSNIEAVLRQDTGLVLQLTF